MNSGKTACIKNSDHRIGEYVINFTSNGVHIIFANNSNQVICSNIANALIKSLPIEDTYDKAKVLAVRFYLQMIFHNFNLIIIFKIN